MLPALLKEWIAHRAEWRAHRNRGGEYPGIDKPMTWRQKREWDKRARDGR